MGIDPAGCDSAGAAQNASLGVVEVELLRRVNPQLDEFTAPATAATGSAATSPQGKLVPRGGERFWPSAERVAELCARGNRIADEVAAARVRRRRRRRRTCGRRPSCPSVGTPTA